MRKKVRSAPLLSGVFSSSPCPHTGQTWAQGFPAALGSSGVRVQPRVVARQRGILSNGDRRAPPRVRPVGVGRRVVGAGGRAVAKELPGAGAPALPGRACSPQLRAAQVRGRLGHGAVGGWALRSLPFPLDTRSPAPPLPARGPALPRKSPPFCGTDASAELLGWASSSPASHVK